VRPRKIRSVLDDHHQPTLPYMRTFNVEREEAMTKINDGGPMRLTELVPLDATDEERKAAEDRAGQLLADLQAAGHDVTCGVDATPDGDVFTFEFGG
jgi:hypothetical protein